MMKQTLLVLACLCVVLVSMLGGCSPINSTVETAAERNRRLVLGGDLQLRMMEDDFDRVLLIDRASRLMPWYGRVE
ncbi:MAG: hypothetical protein NT031_16355 [Planctomycetota bacterium]|nr:hypothetical protein [Planctomycetota bacterium]